MVATAVLMAFCHAGHAAETTTTDDDVQKTEQSAVQEPKGKAIIQVFTNFHSGFGHNNDDRGFDLDRSYVGYEYSLGKGLKVKGVMDIGKSSDVGDYQRIAYIKNAQLSWTHNKLTLSGGLISTTQFKVQEKFWGNRYVMKSFQDQYKFGHSADLGLSVTYRFADWIAADAIITNGEGYKKLQVKDGLAYGAGIELNPLKELTLRVYGGINQKTEDNEKDTYNVATFMGYQNKSFSLGGEYNWIKNAGNTAHSNMQGVSVYGQARVASFARIFGRYDQLFSLGEVNRAKEELALVGGVEFKIGKYIKIAPNFRYADKRHTDHPHTYTGYINCYFGI